MALSGQKSISGIKKITVKTKKLYLCNSNDLMIMKKSSDKGKPATGADATGTDKTSNHVVKKKR
jgi:hypothetical protein